VFGSAVLDVAIGLVFFFFLLSTLALHTNEFVARLFRWRSLDLETALHDMLRSPARVHEILAHPLVGTPELDRTLRQQDPPTVEEALHDGLGPSYIDPHAFALALLDSLVPPTNHRAPLTAHQLRERVSVVDTVPEPVRNALLTIFDTSDGTIAGMRKGVEDWFNANMERVSGLYRRRLMVVNLLTAIAVVAILGFDTIVVAQQLWQEQTLRAAVATASSQALSAGGEDPLSVLRQLNLAIGWSSFPDDWSGRVVKLAGLGVSVLAISLGAPFWFDLLKNLSNLRAAGPKPATADQKDAKATS
jgi:hypothetical protein